MHKALVATIFDVSAQDVWHAVLSRGVRTVSFLFSRKPKVHHLGHIRSGNGGTYGYEESFDRRPERSTQNGRHPPGPFQGSRSSP